MCHTMNFGTVTIILVLVILETFVALSHNFLHLPRSRLDAVVMRLA